MNIDFAKLSGSGNDFICIDDTAGHYSDILRDSARVGKFARRLCERGLGIGADGLIFAISPEVEGVADVSARFFEADGSEAELCGNGTGCFVRWAIETGIVAEGEPRILTPAGVVRGRKMEGGYVRVCIPLPDRVEANVPLNLCGARTCDFAITGVPHAVIYVNDLDAVDMPHLGPAVRYHQRFQPRGVNANFAQVLGEGQLALRTWEFGVEGETLACGTGSAAAAILATQRFGWGEPYRRGEKPVEIHVRSGDVLRVYLTIEDDGHISDLCLETLVRWAYKGTVSQELAQTTLNT